MLEKVYRVGGPVIFGLALMGMLWAAPPQDLPEGDGKAIVQDACSQCHGLQQIMDSKKTHDEWKDLVYQMIDNGATLTDEQIPIVVDYLAKNFAKDKPSTDSAKQ